MKKSVVIVLCFVFIINLTGSVFAASMPQMNNSICSDTPDTDDGAPHYQDPDPNDGNSGPDDVDDGSGWYDDSDSGPDGDGGVLF